MAILVTQPKLAPLPTIRREPSSVDWRLLLFAAIVFSAACIMFFGNLGNTPLFNPDETLYAEPAREMLESGNYIVEYMNYVVRHTKPPVAIWMMVACYKMFGVNEFAARFGGAACGAILALVSALFARKYADERTGWITAAILITTPMFVAVGRESITDMPLSLFTAGSVMAFFHAYQQKAQRWLWVGYVALGLAVMTKGPVGLLVPVAILFIYHLLRSELKSAARFYKLIPGMLLTSCIALPWFVLVIAKTNGDYFRDFIIRENFQRFTSVVDHKGPWWYHILAVFGGLFPWSLFLPAALVVAGKQFMTSRSEVNPVDAKANGIIAFVQKLTGKLKGLEQQQSTILLCLVSAIFIITFYSMSVSKLLAYTLPAFPFIAILIASFLERARQNENSKPFVWGFGILTVAYAAASYIVPFASSKLRDCPPDLAALIPAHLCTLALASGLAWAAALRKQSTVAIPFFAVMLMATNMYFGWQGVSLFANYWESSIKSYAQFAGASNWPIIVFQHRKPSVTFYAHRAIIMVDDKLELERMLLANEHAYIISRDKTANVLSHLGCKILSVEGYNALSVWDRDKLRRAIERKAIVPSPVITQ